jgi:hypothetical protein
LKARSQLFLGSRSHAGKVDGRDRPRIQRVHEEAVALAVLELLAMERPPQASFGALLVLVGPHVPAQVRANVPGMVGQYHHVLERPSQLPEPFLVG